jgi:hypothetical protein
VFLDRTADAADRAFDWNYNFASDPERCITVRCLLAIATAHAAFGVPKHSAHVPASSGVFAQRLARSEAVHTALGLFDDGRCTLAAPHAFWLFPQLGTRPIWWPTEVGKRTRADVRPSCVLLLRERVEFNTDSARFHDYFERLAHSSRARLLRRDGSAELWWMPPAQALRGGAQPL